MTRVEKIKEEIARNYYCNGDEEECVQFLTDDLNKFEEEIRADERAKTLDEIKEIISTKTNPMYWIEKMTKEQK